MWVSSEAVASDDATAALASLSAVLQRGETEIGKCGTALKNDRLHSCKSGKRSKLATGFEGEQLEKRGKRTSADQWGGSRFTQDGADLRWRNKGHGSDLVFRVVIGARWAILLPVKQKGN